jgi:hypothetical protein
MQGTGKATQGGQGNGKPRAPRTRKGTGTAPVQAAQAALHGAQAGTLRCKATAGCNGTQAMHGAVPAVLHGVQAAQRAGVLPPGTPGNGAVQAVLAAVAGLPFAGHVPGARGTGAQVQVLPLPYGKGKGKVPGKPQALPGNVQAGVQALHAAYVAQAAVPGGNGGAQAQRYYALLGQLVRAAYAAAAAAPAPRAPRKAQAPRKPRTRTAQAPQAAPAQAPAAAPQGQGTGGAA